MDELKRFVQTISVLKIAKKHGVSKGAVYRHYKKWNIKLPSQK